MAYASGGGDTLFAAKEVLQVPESRRHFIDLREAYMLKNVSTPASLLLLSCSILIFTAAYAFINRYQFLATETQVIKYDTFTNTMTGYRGSTAEEVNLDTGAYRNYNIIKTTR